MNNFVKCILMKFVDIQKYYIYEYKEKFYTNLSQNRIYFVILNKD